MERSKKDYWEHIYQTRQADEVSWTQQVPQASLDFIDSFGLNPDARILDAGGGDSRLVDHLLDRGFRHITVLDISEQSLDRARRRLGDRAGEVEWVVSDVLSYQPVAPFDLWHDRAVFHFLTQKREVDSYIHLCRRYAAGYLLLGTFSEHGPKMCSGLPVRSYSHEQLTEVFRKDFDNIRCIHVDHETPFHSHQEFTFCSFRHRAA